MTNSYWFAQSFLCFSTESLFWSTPQSQANQGKLHFPSASAVSSASPSALRIISRALVGLEWGAAREVLKQSTPELLSSLGYNPVNLYWNLCYHGLSAQDNKLVHLCAFLLFVK